MKYIAFLLLAVVTNAFQVNLEVTDNLPQLCFSSEDVVPRYVNAICHHHNKTYLGGFFNRIGDESAQHFAVLNEDDTIDYLGTIGMVTSLENVLASSSDVSAGIGSNSSFLGIVTSLACPENSEYIYLGGVFSTITDHAGEEQILNNVARFNTETREFSPIKSNQPLPNNDHIGFKQFCDERDNSDEYDECDDANQVTMIRSIQCVGVNGTCEFMHVGGYFDTVLGVNNTLGIALLDLSDYDNPKVTKIGRGKESTEGVNGLVMTIASVSPTEIVFGGIYEDPVDSDVPYLINRWTKGKGMRCVVNRLMRDQSACQVDSPPLLCCELIFGPVYSSLRISKTDLLIGGEFVNTFDFTPRADTSADITQWFQPGYQNVAIVSATEEDEGKDSSFGDGGSLVGGPDGDVRAITCSRWLPDSDEDRCETVYIAGSFNSWLNFSIGEDLELRKSELFKTPFHVAKLVWDSDTESYHPEPAFESADLTFVKGDISVNAITSRRVTGDSDDEIYFGGELPSIGNVAKFSHLTSKIEKVPSNHVGMVVDENSPWYDCSKESNMRLFGASFCCRAGSYCPGGLIDISCPDGWGFYCTEDTIGICEEGHYCPTAGQQIPCSKGHVCRMGSIAQRKCEFWELCADVGMERPERVSGLILGSIILVGMFSTLVLFVWVFSWRVGVGNTNNERQFHLRFNAFKRELSGRNKGKRGKFDGISGVTEIDLASVSSGKHKAMAQQQQSAMEESYDEDGRSRSSSSFIVDPSGSFSNEDNPPLKLDEVINKRELKVDIEFNNLTVELVNKKKILNGVTGKLRAGRMTAIMGPSGCGKSTFLCALTNRIRDGGKVLGDVKINGVTKPLLTIQHLIGFVPQEDIMHRDLSVRENLRFYSHLKSHPEMSRTQRRAFVNEIIDILGLSHVQHSLIGDELTRGISGGQRKRVNIGIELMASPLILFLDEPTSGLDSTTTQQLIDSLEKLAGLGLTIAMVIHQPRYEVLLKIDDLILLQKGGFPVYIGETVNALGYFEDYLGKPLPKICTPADHFLDVISADQGIENGFHCGNICDMWREYPGKSHDDSDYQDRIIPFRFRPSRPYQLYSFFKRTFYQMMNTRVAFFTDCVLLVFAGGMVGIVSVEELQAYQLTMMTTGLFAVVSSLKVFGLETVVFMRETSAGISTLGYFLGKCVAHLFQIFLNPIFFLGLYYRTAYPSVEFWTMYRVVLATQFSCSGLGYLISVLCGRTNMQIAGVLTALVAEMLSGLNPSARTLGSFLAGKIGLWLSFGPWTMGSLLIKQTVGSAKALYPIYVGTLDNFGYLNLDNSTLINEDAINDSKVVLDDAYKHNLSHLYTQYFMYSFLAYFVMMCKGKNASGMLGLSSLIYLLREDIIDPLHYFLRTGKTVRENLTAREKIIRRQSLSSGGSGGSNGKRKSKDNMKAKLLEANERIKSVDTVDSVGSKSIKFGVNADGRVDDGATGATGATGSGKKEMVLSADQLEDEKWIRDASDYRELCKIIKGGKKAAKKLVDKLLGELRDADQIGSVSNDVGSEAKFLIIKAAIRDRTPTIT